VVPALAAAEAEELCWSARDNVNYNETAMLRRSMTRAAVREAC